VGFSIKRAIRGVTKGVLGNPIISGSVGAILGVPPQISSAITGFYRAGRSPTGGMSYAGGGQSQVGAYVPALQSGMMTDTGEVVGAGGMVQTGGLVKITQLLASAVFKLAERLGIPLAATTASVSRVGGRVWTSITAFAARNPGLNVLTLLLGLGLTAEEAAHFLAWGATKKRRRRGRGISAANLRITRRTIRKVVRISHDLRALAHVAGSTRRFSRGTQLIRQG
jgi:hypothetical protein